MGTVKYTGPVASFHCPTNAEIRSLKVHFSPKQEGTGDPSPENVRPIVGWDGVEVHESRKNMGHIVGYSATTLSSPLNRRNITNTYGTTLNTVDPESSLIITQTVWPETTNIDHYKNGYIAIELDNLVFNQYYDISFKVTNITNNPLNATLQSLGLGVPSGTRRGPTEIRDNVLIYKNFCFTQRDISPNEIDFNLRICGMSFTLSEFMVTPSNTNDGIYESYTDKRIVTWNQWLQPLTSDNWQAYNTSKISTTFENGIATSTWLTNDSGYGTSVRNKVGTLQKNKEVWYISYMLKSSIGGGTWGAEYNGGLQNAIISSLDADTWCQCSEANLYWRGSRNYVYFSYYRGGISDHIGMVAQIKSPLFINLTQMFGLGNEPTKEEFEAQCALNGIDLTSALPYNEGTVMEWKTNGEEIKNTITFPILGKNKFNINSLFAEPSDTTSNNVNRIFQPYTYCLGLSSGNNYLPSKITDVSITNGTLSFTSDNTSYGVAFAIPLLYGTYRLSYTGENVSATLVRYDKNGQYGYFGSSTMDAQGIFTIGKNVDITCIIFKPTTANTQTTVTNIQLEEDKTITSYEAFDPKHTVYGGWVDLITGEVAEEYTKYILNGTETGWSLDGSEDVRRRVYIDTARFNNVAKQKGIVYSNYCKTTSTTNNWYVWISTGGTLTSCFILFFIPSTLDTVDKWKEYLSENPLDIVYELATPNTYHITPTQLQTFLGHNNVWSNADYVEVEYDLHETQSLLQRKAFIMANQPHIIKPAAAALQNFKTDVIAPLKECKVHFGPVQDLHGYSNPWPAGGGKNLWNDNDVIYGVWTASDGVVSSNTSGCRSQDISTTAGNVYTVFFNGERPYSASIVELDENKDFILRTHKQWSGVSSPSALTVTISNSTKYFYVQTYNNNIEETITFPILASYKIQLEKGSTATSYTPYENVCPISGWNGVDVYRSGKNLFDINLLAANNITISNGVATATATNFSKAFGSSFVPLNLDMSTNRWTLTMTAYTEGNSSTADATGLVARFVYTDGTKQIMPFNNQNTSPTTLSITSTINKTPLGIQISYGSIGANIWHITNIQLEPVLEATSYEPYTGTTLPIDWTTEAGTVYGGYVDLVKGEAVAEYVLMEKSWSEWTLHGQQNNTTRKYTEFNVDIYDSSQYSQVSHISNIAKYSYTWTQMDETHFYFSSSRRVYMWLPIGTDESTVIQVVGHLIMPIHYSLTPSTLKTLRGTNNIWSNANGNIELAYWSH